MLIRNVLYCTLAFFVLSLNLVGEVQAASQDIVVQVIQSEGVGIGTASEELVVIRNISSVDVRVDDYCVNYSSSNNDPNLPESNKRILACVTGVDGMELWLTSGGDMLFATQEFVDFNYGFSPDFLFSSGLARSGGHVWVSNISGEIVDKVGWGSAISPEGNVAEIAEEGEVLGRKMQAEQTDTDNNIEDLISGPLSSSLISGLFELEPVNDLCLNVEGLQALPEEIPEGYLQDESSNCYQDLCLNIEGLQAANPEEYLIDAQGECIGAQLEDSTVLISELRPNAPSFDSGKEFIEIFNPNNFTVNTEGYSLQLGPNFTKEYIFPVSEIESGEYLALSDTETGIILPNSASTTVRLVALAGNVVSETAPYVDAPDDASWSLLEGEWLFTNQSTPGGANLPPLQTIANSALSDPSSLAPCPEGKFRNPETNRCKSIATTSSSLVPCGAGQERNPETNRCRSVSGAISSLTPCKEGQTRNPDTNRCRNSSLGSEDQFSAQISDVVTEDASGQINWTVIFLTLLATLSYMVYEWRVDIAYKYRMLHARLAD